MKSVETEIIHTIEIPTPFLVGSVNAYLIKGKQNILVDTGPATEAAETALRAGLNKAGVSIKEIDQLVLTHHHPDHVGLAYLFEGTAVISGHEKMKPWLHKDEKHYKNVYQFFEVFFQENGMDKQFINQIKEQHQKYMTYVQPVELQEVLKETMHLPGSYDWEVLETPGHAQTHISILRKEDTVLVAGDHIISHISSNAIMEAPYRQGEERPKTLLQYRKSLEKCLNVSTVYPGHGEIINHPQALIEKRLKKQLSKAEMFLCQLNEEPLTVFDLCKKVYPEIYLKQPDLTFSETLGHLDLLEERESVHKYWNSGKLYYTRDNPNKPHREDSIK